MFNKLRAILVLSRPQNALPAILVLLISYFYMSTQNVPTTDLWYTVVALLFLSMFATVQNDIEDYEIDKSNNKVNGLHGKFAVSVRDAQAISYLLLITVIFCAIIVNNPLVSVLIFIGYILAYLYNRFPFYLSRKSISSILILTCTGVLLPFLVAIVLHDNSVKFGGLLLLASFTMQRLSIIVLKDYKDIKGDLKYNKHTFLQLYSGDFTRKFSNVLGVFGYVLLAIAIALITIEYTARSVALSIIIIACMVYVCILRYKLSPSKYEKNIKLFTEISTYNLYVDIGILCLIIL